jgi:hypothetical protein
MPHLTIIIAQSLDPTDTSISIALAALSCLSHGLVLIPRCPIVPLTLIRLKSLLRRLEFSTRNREMIGGCPPVGALDWDWIEAKALLRFSVVAYHKLLLS